MSDYTITYVSSQDKRLLAEIDALLSVEGLTRDKNLDYICAALDEADHVVATGSCFGQTLRCFAVEQTHQGEGLLNTIVSHLIELQINRGNSHLFVYTKVSTAKFFQSLGFYEIVRVDGVVSFLENRRSGFSDYLNGLRVTARSGLSGAVVMNANPFTLGHRYLVETAAAVCDTLHLFVLSEDASLVPFSVRMELVRRGTADLPNVVIHGSGPYLISAATFPSYFLKDSETVIEAHARLDAAIFAKIAGTLGISKRFVGEELSSTVTARYNAVMEEELPKSGIALQVIPRKSVGSQVISASTVRAALQTGAWDVLKAMLPETTLAYFRSPEAKPVIEAIRQAGNVIHY